MTGVVASVHDHAPAGGERTPLAMVVGPTRPAASVLARLAAPARPLTDHTFIAEFGACLRSFRALVGAPDAAVVVVPGTGTTGLESAVVSLLDPGRPVLVVSTGMWGDRLRDICLRNGIRVDAPTTDPGHAPDLVLLERLLAGQAYQAVLVTHVDSSSGVRVDIRAIADLADRHGALCVVDGIAAIGAEEIEQRAWGVDVYLGSPAKALAAPPGLALFSLSPRAVHWIEHRAWTPANYSLDLASWLPVMSATERGEFAFFQTTAGNLVDAFGEALRLVLAEGRAERVIRHAALRDRLHAGLAEIGVELLVPDRVNQANGVTVCRLPGPIPCTALLDAVAEEGVLLQAGTHPVAGSRTFRIGHMGNVTEDDIETTLEAIRRARHP